MTMSKAELIEENQRLKDENEAMSAGLLQDFLPWLAIKGYLNPAPDNDDDLIKEYFES